MLWHLLRGTVRCNAKLRNVSSSAFYSLPVKLRVPALLALVEEQTQSEIADALGHQRGCREGSRLSCHATASQETKGDGNHAMTNQADDDDALRQLLRAAVPPTSTELDRDLWPGMLRRLNEKPAGVPWFDWAMAGALVVLLAIAPGAIPILLYQL